MLRRFVGVFALASMMCTTTSAAPRIKTNSIGMRFSLIPAGTFMMGAPKGSCLDCPIDDPYTEQDESASCQSNCIGETTPAEEMPVHEVAIRRSFWMGRTEVTQKQWYKIMGNNPADFKTEKLGWRSLQNPVEQISWVDATRFLNAMSRREGRPECYGPNGTVSKVKSIYTCRGYRLPTEAEWEYAAKAGTKGSRYLPLKTIAWHQGNSNRTTQPVGWKKPNQWGLFDILGNVDEWCHDSFKAYPNKRQVNPSHSYGEQKVYRGGSWLKSSSASRATARFQSPASWKNNSQGFRVVLTNY